MPSQAQYFIKCREPHMVMARAKLLGVNSNPPTVVEDPSNLISGITRTGEGQFVIAMNDDWAFLGGKAQAEVDSDSFCQLYQKSITRGANEMFLVGVASGSADDLDGVTIGILFILQRG